MTFKHTVVGEVLPKLRAEELPLYRLLDRIADPTLDEKTNAVSYPRYDEVGWCRPRRRATGSRTPQRRKGDIQYRLLDRIADPTLDEKYRDEPSDVDPEGPGGTAG